MRPRTLRWWTGIAALALVTGCGAAVDDGVTDAGPVADEGDEAPADGAPAAEDGAADPDGTVTPSATELVTGLTTPWDVQPLADGALLVSSRDTAEILLVAADGGTEVVGEVADAAPAGEGGLLGLALSEDGGTLFAYVTTAEDNRVVAMSWDGATLGAPSVILEGIPKGQIHNGGGLAVGPDGYLYVGTGDAGDGALAPDPDSLAGKILRIDGDGAAAPENPSGTVVLTTGHRNVQGLAFDEDDRLWASELGQNTWDELNLVEPGGDYGWPGVEGTGGAEEGFVDPVLQWSTADASPSGLAYWQGSLWMAALRGERLWQIPLADDGSAGEPVAHLAGELGRLRAVATSVDGATLLLGTSNTDGNGDVRDDDDRLLLLESG